MVELSIGLGIVFLVTLALFTYHGPELRRRMAERMTPIKTSHDRTVYALDKDNVRHVIPDWNTFVSSGFDVNDIHTIDDKEMAGYAEGEAVGAIESIPSPILRCPCDRSGEYDVIIKANIAPAAVGSQICLVHTAEAMSVFGHSLSDEGLAWVSSMYNGTYFKGITEVNPELAHCIAVVEIGGHDAERMIKYECPEQCLPVPYTFLPVSWIMLADKNSNHNAGFNLHSHDLLVNQFNPHQPVTCSMTFAQLFGGDIRTYGHHLVHAKGGTHNHIASFNMTHTDILRAVAQRRFEECKEDPYWKLVGNLTMSSVEHKFSGSKASVKHLAIERRLVHGLIIWVGSTSRYFLMQRQITILANLSADPSTTVVGWMASEAQYPCRLGSTLCDSASNTNSYFGGMPSTRMNFASGGWCCAQRRPLRALAHTLRLYNPTYILLVDDDTYVSKKVIESQPFDHLIRNYLASELLILGQLTKGRKVTRKGFYYGGAGYLFGKNIVDRLESHTIHGPESYSTGMLDPGQVGGLSVLYEAHIRSQEHCPHTCLTNLSTTEDPKVNSSTLAADIQRYYHVTGESKVRLVDLCVNMMSLEKTCYHSDHAMSRCLIHGTYGGPLNVECGGSNIGPENMLMGMCMGINVCDPAYMLTCHRWTADAKDPAKPAGVY